MAAADFQGDACQLMKHEMQAHRQGDAHEVLALAHGQRLHSPKLWQAVLVAQVPGRSL